jgi:hypothetical protein
MVALSYAGTMEEFGVHSTVVITLGLSLFVMGLGFFPCTF